MAKRSIIKKGRDFKKPKKGSTLSTRASKQLGKMEPYLTPSESQLTVELSEYSHPILSRLLSSKLGGDMLDVAVDTYSGTQQQKLNRLFDSLSDVSSFDLMKDEDLESHVAFLTGEEIAPELNGEFVDPFLESAKPISGISSRVVEGGVYLPDSMHYALIDLSNDFDKFLDLTKHRIESELSEEDYISTRKRLMTDLSKMKVDDFLESLDDTSQNIATDLGSLINSIHTAFDAIYQLRYDYTANLLAEETRRTPTDYEIQENLLMPEVGDAKKLVGHNIDLIRKRLNITRSLVNQFLDERVKSELELKMATDFLMPTTDSVGEAQQHLETLKDYYENISPLLPLILVGIRFIGSQQERKDALQSFSHRLASPEEEGGLGLSLSTINMNTSALQGQIINLFEEGTIIDPSYFLESYLTDLLKPEMNLLNGFDLESESSFYKRGIDSIRRHSNPNTVMSDIVAPFYRILIPTNTPRASLHYEKLKSLLDDMSDGLASYREALRVRLQAKQLSTLRDKFTVEGLDEMIDSLKTQADVVLNPLMDNPFAYVPNFHSRLSELSEERRRLTE